MKECIYNHNPNDIENSLQMLKRRNMVHPEIYKFICTECHEIFTFKRLPNGAFEEIQ